MLLDPWGAGSVMFRDWETGEIVRCIDLDARSMRNCCVFVLTGYMQVYQPGTGSPVAIAAENPHYDLDAYDVKLDDGAIPLGPLTASIDTPSVSVVITKPQSY
jgi:hypothetical protein